MDQYFKNIYDLIPPLTAVTSDFFVFIVGGIAGLVARKCRITIQNVIRNRRMRLSGEFLSFFDDVIGSQRVLQRSTSKVVQKGNDVEIITENKDRRAWILSGKLKDDMYILGDYNAVDIHDGGVGTFFLQIRNRDLLEGYWHGYDHINSTVTGGKYWFMRKMQFDVERAQESDIPAIVGILNKQLGIGYMNNIESLIGDNSYSILIAKDDSQICGFSIARKLPENSLSGIIGSDMVDPPNRYFDENALVGVIKTLAVRDGYQKKGIGYTLFKASEAALMNCGVRTIIVPAWASPKGINISGILQTNEYKKIGEIHDYWKEGCEKREFSCPERLENACKCSCVLYQRVMYDRIPSRKKADINGVRAYMGPSIN